MTGRALVVRGDARRLPLPDASVDLVVTSPPYWGLRSYRDGGEHFDGQVGDEMTWRAHLDALLEVTRELVRVLKPTGSIFVNLGDKYGGAQGQQNNIHHRAARLTPEAVWARTKTTGFPRKSLMLLPERYRIACVDELGLIVRAVIVWSKPNGLPESVKDRVRRSHEDWVHLTVQRSYYADLDAIRQPHAEATVARAQLHRAPFSGQAHRDSDMPRTAVARDQMLHPEGALPGSVWTIPTEPLRVPPHLGVDHYAGFPSEWPRRLILGWSPADGVVLDPFGGSGTTAMVARALGRTAITVDLSHDYGRLADWRIHHSGHDAKVRNRTWADRQQALDVASTA